MILARNIFLHIIIIHAQIAAYLCICELRYSKKKTYALCEASALVMSLVYTLTAVTLSPYIASCLVYLTVTLPSFLLCRFISVLRGKRFVLTFFIANITVSTAENISIFLCLLLFKGANLSYLILRPLFIAGFVLLLRIFIRKNYIDLLHSMDTGWTVVVAEVLVLYAILAVYFTCPIPIVYRSALTLSDFLILASIIAAVVGLLSTAGNLRRIYQLKLDESTYKMELMTADFRIQQGEQQTKLLEERVEEIRTIRHDIRHHYKVIAGLCAQENYTELNAYIKTLDFTEITQELPLYSKNHVANIFIGYYKSLAESQGIRFLYTVELPDGIPENPSHLGIILGNAFQNALEAAQRSLPGDSYMDTKMKYVKGNLVLVMKNTFDGTVLPLEDGYQSVKTSDLHGIGLKSIRHIVDSYNGFFQAQHEEHVFTLKVVLPLDPA